MRKILTIGGLIFSLAIIGWPKTLPINAASPFSGKILLAVEGHGEAWYINPTDQKRYYLGRPADAFQVMRGLAIGISNSDFALLEKNKLAPTKVQRLLGRILLKPQDTGKAYYFEPSHRQLYYLGRPSDAFRIMKETAVGAANEHIDPIPTGLLKISPQLNQTPAISPTAKVWRWNWQGREYTITLKLTAQLYSYYQKQSKVFSYTGSLPNNWQEQYYGRFLTGASQENIVRQIVEQLRRQAQANNLTADQTAELAAAFVQSIPYDQERSQLIQNHNSQATPNYPYETLYLNKGVCTDKTLLAWMIFHKLGYGTVLMSYPAANHMALGIACPKTAANYQTGYCYMETTQFYHIGLIPNDISGQAASTTDSSLPSWQPSGNLAEPQLYQAANGRSYGHLPRVKNLIQEITGAKASSTRLHNEITAIQPTIDAQQAELQRQQKQLDDLKTANQLAEYNRLVPAYNQAVQVYEQTRQQYNQKIGQFNEVNQLYNRLLAELQPSQTSK